jgi:hypothetical protein
VGETFEKNLGGKTDNKIPYSFFFLIFLSFVGCKKETVEVPEERSPVNTELISSIPGKPDSIHGYLYAGYWFQRLPKSSTQTLTTYAVFGDPARNLCANFNHFEDSPLPKPDKNQGNISSSGVTFNTVPLTASYQLYYYLKNTGYYLFDNKAVWASKGNTTFLPLNQNITKGFPKIVDTLITQELKISNGFTVHTNKYFGGCDSACVTIKSSYFTQPFLQKSVVANSSVYFAPEELNFLRADSSARLTLGAFNYSYIILNDKRYLFELSNKMESRLLITP